MAAKCLVMSTDGATVVTGGSAARPAVWGWMAVTAEVVGVAMADGTEVGVTWIPSGSPRREGLISSCSWGSGFTMVGCRLVRTPVEIGPGKMAAGVGVDGGTAIGVIKSPTFLEE